VCREYAAREGWTLLPEQVYTDAALSGASLDRPGIQGLLAAAAHRTRPFDVVLADDSSRVSRDLADALRVLQTLRFHGIRVIYVAQQIDSASEQAETLVAVRGLVDGLFLRDLRAKIQRGLAGQIARGFATGSVTFGYRTVPVPDPSGRVDLNGNAVLTGKRVEVVPDEAAVIVRVSEWYADGLGIYSIVERLNREDVRGPRGARWRPGAVKRLLLNEEYRGRLIWGQRTYDRRPGTAQKVARAVPRELWRVQEHPELRIVSDDLWARVEGRRLAVRAALPAGRMLMRGRNAALFSKHLFSGFTRCANCGGAVTVVAGGHGSPRYGCQRSWRSGESQCSNRLTVRAKIADAHLLEPQGRTAGAGDRAVHRGAAWDGAQPAPR
jgi:DNA invertase Pin-like site-specific DNA recombinase